MTNDPVLVGAGDISSFAQNNDEMTAKLLGGVVSGVPGEVVFTAGDNAYESGTDAEFEQCYDPTWGRYKDRTRPAPGNHEYKSGKADGYFKYFGAAAGDPTRVYYSYDLGNWRIVVLNTSDHCQLISCDKGSPQEEWLRSDLEAHPTLALWQSGTTHSSPRGRHAAVRTGWSPSGMIYSCAATGPSSLHTNFVGIMILREREPTP